MKSNLLFELILFLIIINLISKYIITFYLKKSYPADYHPIHGIIIKEYLKYWYSIIINPNINSSIRVLTVIHIIIYCTTIFFTFAIFIIFVFLLIK